MLCWWGTARRSRPAAAPRSRRSWRTPGIDEEANVLKRIGQVHVNVHDLDRATRFYQEVLGLRLLFRAGGMSFFDCGGVRLMLSPPERPEYDHAASIVYYKVDDIDAVHATLRERGVRFHGEPHLIARMPDQ